MITQDKGYVPTIQGKKLLQKARIRDGDREFTGTEGMRFENKRDANKRAPNIRATFRVPTRRRAGMFSEWNVAHGIMES